MSRWRRRPRITYRIFRTLVEANNKMAEVTWMLKAIHAQEDRQEAQKKATEVMG